MKTVVFVLYTFIPLNYTVFMNYYFREKARQWVRSQAATLIAEHGSANGGRGGGTHPASGVLARLTAAVQRLRAPDTELMQMALIQLRDVLVDSDISPFEVYIL